MHDYKNVIFLVLNTYVSLPDREFGVLRQHNAKQYGTADSSVESYPCFPEKYNEIRECHEKSYI